MFLNNFKQNTRAAVIGLLFSILYSLFSVSTVGAAVPFALDWATNTYTPAGYQGKKLPIEGSRITVTVTPLAASGAKYYYKWYVDGVRQNNWEANPAEFVITAGRRDANVEVKIGIKTTRTVSGVSLDTFSEIGSERAVIRVQNPELLVYRESEGRRSLLRETTLAPGARAKFRAIPYFFNVTLPSALRFRWNFAGNEMSGDDVEPDVLLLSIKEASRRMTGLLTFRAEDDRGKSAIGEVKIVVE